MSVDHFNLESVISMNKVTSIPIPNAIISSMSTAMLWELKTIGCVVRMALLFSSCMGSAV